MPEPRSHKRWWFGYAKTTEMLIEAYTKAIPADQQSHYKPSDMSLMTWSSGKVPNNVAEIIEKPNRIRLEVLINSLINCGCGGARADMAKSLRSLEFITASKTAIQGVKDLASHAARKARITYFKRIK